MNITDFLLGIIDFFYRLVPNYGVAIILFTVFVKLCLTPLDLKSRRSMKRTAALNPKMEALRKKYGNDREKLNQKTQELYKAEGVSMLSGCLPMLLTLPILFAMFGAMRSVANAKLVEQYLQLTHGIAPTPEPFLWIRNLWMPDTFTSPMYPDLNALRAVGQSVWEKVSLTIPNMQPLVFGEGKVGADAFKAYLDNIPAVISATQAYQPYLQTLAGWGNVPMLFFKFSLYIQRNGYFILPLLAVGTQYITQKLMPTSAPSSSGTDQAASMNKSMMLMMPIMSLIFCTTSSAAFALYWVTSNIIAGIQQFFFARYFDWQDRKAAVAEEVGIK